MLSAIDFFFILVATSTEEKLEEQREKERLREDEHRKAIIKLKEENSKHVEEALIKYKVGFPATT